MAKIKVKLRDLVNGQMAMKALGSRPIFGKVSYQVGKAIKAALAEIETYNEKAIVIIKKNGGKPSEDGGFQLVKSDPNYETAWKEMDEHSKSALDADVELDGLKPVKLDELLDALLEVPEVKDEEGNVVTKAIPKGTIEPLILAGMDWFIVE